MDETKWSITNNKNQYIMNKQDLKDGLTFVAMGLVSLATIFSMILLFANN